MREDATQRPIDQMRAAREAWLQANPSDSLAILSYLLAKIDTNGQATSEDVDEAIAAVITDHPAGPSENWD